jgi:uncharacterized metal-binding protein
MRSGIGKVHGLLTREATYLVIDEIEPEQTETMCLGLFVKGEAEAVEAVKTQPCITVDGCPKQCAKLGTEKHSGPVSGEIVVSEILGTTAASCSRSSRGASQVDKDAVSAIAEKIALEVDKVLANR